MKNLVMGAAIGYSWDILEPFVLSCMVNCPSAELVLIVDDISDFTRDRLIRHGVKLENFPDELKSGIPNNTRWKIFADFLDAHGDFEKIFITDTRDVIFQADVFAKFNGLTNWLGYATESDDIGGTKTGSTTNFNWLVDCFDEAAAQRLADKKIICSGTVIGSIDAMKIFCRELWKILEHKPEDIFDQAVMNYLVWNKLLPIENLIESDVHGGEVFTCALIGGNKIFGDKILRGDGEIPAVVHQYDRHEDLVRLVDEIYHDKNFQADNRFTDTRSIVEQTTSLLLADKINAAAKIFFKSCLLTADLEGCTGALSRLLSIAVRKKISKPLELLELAVQSVGKNFIFHGIELYYICMALNRVEKSGHPVDFEFKAHVANIVLSIAKNDLELNCKQDFLNNIKLIDMLNMPPDKNYFLFLAKANRIFGLKEEALAAYKKVLELS